MKRRTFFRSLAALAGLRAVKPLELLANNKATSKYATWEYETKWMTWDSGYEMPHYYRIYRKSTGIFNSHGIRPCKIQSLSLSSQAP